MKQKQFSLIDYKKEYIKWLKEKGIEVPKDIPYNDNLELDFSSYDYDFSEDCDGRNHMGWVIDNEIAFLDELAYDYDRFILFNLGDFFYKNMGKGRFDDMLDYIYGFVKSIDSINRVHQLLTNQKINEIKNEFQITDDFEYGKIQASDVSYAIREICKLILNDYNNLKKCDDLMDYFFRFDQNYGCYVLRKSHKIKIYDF